MHCVCETNGHDQVHKRHQNDGQTHGVNQAAHEWAKGHTLRLESVCGAQGVNGT